MAVKPIKNTAGKTISWELTCYTAGGKLLRKRFRTEKLARDAEAAERLKRRANRGDLAARDLTLQQLFNVYLQQWAPTVRESTARARESVWRTHLEPTIGTTRLDRLTAGQVQSLLTTRARTHEPGTVQNILTTVRAVVRWAVQRGILDRDPLVTVRPPRAETPRTERVKTNSWSVADVRRVLRTADELLLDGGIEDIRQPGQLAAGVPLILAMLWTGLRSGEARALEWGDIDEQAIHVCRTWSPARTGTIERLNEPKTKASHRSVIVLPPLRQVLVYQRKAQADRRQDRIDQGLPWGADPYGRSGDWVFDNGEGGPIGSKLLERHLQRLATIAGVRPVTPHGLRHTFATAGMELGIPPKVVSEMLGHSRVGITLDIYTHVALELQEQLGERLTRGFTQGLKRDTGGPKIEPPARIGDISVTDSALVERNAQ